jgi:uncharacterized membrane protein YtjA (UPF0391 family)
VKRFFTDMNPTLRGFLIIALIAGVVVVLSLEEVLATVGGLLRIAFFLAIAFFLFLLWRERRSDIEAWSDRSRKVFVHRPLTLGWPERARVLPRARCVRVCRRANVARGASLRLTRVEPFAVPPRLFV